MCFPKGSLVVGERQDWLSFGGNAKEDQWAWRSRFGGRSLWGHDRSGPYTILEGNNRLTAYESTGRTGKLSLPVLVGLSATYLCLSQTRSAPRTGERPLEARYPVAGV